MNAVRKKREFILEEKKKAAEEMRIQELQRLKEETMKCNIISQRITLQEYLLTKETEISEKIDFYFQNEDDYKMLNREMTEQIFDEWLSEFNLI